MEPVREEAAFTVLMDIMDVGGYQLAATRVFQFILAATADCELLVTKS